MNVLEQGIELQRQAKFAEALPFLEQAVREDPNSSRAWINLSEAQLETEHYDASLKAAEEALKLDSRDAQALLMKGRALNNLNRPEEAIAACNKALTYDPNLAFAHTYKGRILAKQGRDHEALMAFDEALALDSTSQDALAYKATSLGVLERFDEATIVGDRLINLDPTSPVGWRIKAMSLHLGPRANKEALQAIQKALEIDPNDSYALTVKSAILDDMGRHGEARALLKRAAALDHTNELAHEGLAEMNKARNEQALHVTGGIIATIFRVTFAIIGGIIKAVFKSL